MTRRARPLAAAAVVLAALAFCATGCGSSGSDDAHASSSSSSSGAASGEGASGGSPSGAPSISGSPTSALPPGSEAEIKHMTQLVNDAQSAVDKADSDAASDK